MYKPKQDQISRICRFKSCTWPLNRVNHIIKAKRAVYVLFKAQTRSNLTSFVDFKNLNRVRLILNFQIRLKNTHDKKHYLLFKIYGTYLFYSHNLSVKWQPRHAYFCSDVVKMNKVEICLQKNCFQNKRTISWCVVAYESLCVYTSAAV